LALRMNLVNTISPSLSTAKVADVIVALFHRHVGAAALQQGQVVIVKKRGYNIIDRLRELILLSRILLRSSLVMAE
jgi:hypothetical protein